MNWKNLYRIPLFLVLGVFMSLALLFTIYFGKLKARLK